MTHLLSFIHHFLTIMEAIVTGSAFPACVIIFQDEFAVLLFSVYFPMHILPQCPLKCQNGSIFLLLNRRQYSDCKYSDTILSTAPKCYLNIYDAHYQSIKGSPKMNMETFQEPQTNLSYIQAVQPTAMTTQQASIKKNQYFKAYEAIYRRLVIQHSDLILFLKGNDTDYKDLQLSEQQRELFARFFTKYSSQQPYINADTFESVNQQLRMMLAKRVEEVYRQLSERELQQYDKTITQISNQLERWHLPKEELTGYTLFKIDMLSLLLRQNARYKQLVDPSCQQFYYPLALQKIFGLSKEIVVYCCKIYEKLKSCLRYDYWDQIKIVVEILDFIQIRQRISSFRKKMIKQQLKKLAQFTLAEPNMSILEEHLSVKDENLKYRFSELAFFESRKKKIQQAGFKIKQQIMLKVHFLQQQDGYQKRMGFLKIALDYGIQITSFLQYIKSIQDNKRDEDIEQGRRIMKSLAKFQWYFVKGDQISAKLSVQKITGIQLKENELYDKKGRYSFIWKKLYILGMERLKLASIVFQTQMKVQAQFQHKLQIFISNWEYFYQGQSITGDNLENHSKKKKQSKQKCLTLVMATTNTHKLLFYSIASHRVKRDYQYLDILKKCFRKQKFKEEFSVNMYSMDYNRNFQQRQQYILTKYMKKNYGADVYIITSCPSLTSHFLVSQMVRSYARSLTHLVEQKFFDKLKETIHRVFAVLSRWIGWYNQ